MKILLIMLVIFIFTACGNGEEGPVEINVVTSFGAYYGVATNAFMMAMDTFLETTDVSINHIRTEVVNEDWKERVVNYFHTGYIPDVLFFFTGADADELVLANYFVPISEIRRYFPDFARNMQDSLLPVSPADGRQFAVPVSGFWQGLFVNTYVLEKSGVDLPDANHTWEQFLEDCQAILDAGFTPIAVSLYEIPHYWFEFAVLNNGGMSNHLTLPASSADVYGQAWADGLRDIKYLYTRGFLSERTLYDSDAQTSQKMIRNEAAFMIDGSWKMSWFQLYALENIENFAVTYVPARKENRDASHIIGGLSMGYFLTRYAWDNPQRRQAGVDFIKAMTADDVVASFGTLAMTALVNVIPPPEDADSYIESVVEMIRGTTGVVAAVQDILTTQARRTLFEYIPYVVRGYVTAEEAIDRSLVFN